MGNNLERLRSKNGITQRELAKLLDTSVQRIHYLEKVSLNEKNAKELSQILGEPNLFKILGTDSLKLLPKTVEEKEELLKIVESIEVE